MLVPPTSKPLPHDSDESEDLKSSRAEEDIEVDHQPQVNALLSGTKNPIQQMVTSPTGISQTKGTEPNPVSEQNVAPDDSVLPLKSDHQASIFPPVTRGQLATLRW